MEEYYSLLQQAKGKIEELRDTVRSIGKEFIPKLYKALKENSLNPEDARKKIERDCNCLWSKRTILEALPDEAKDRKKQKAGRLRQKRLNSAALSAAQLGHAFGYDEPLKIKKGRPYDLHIKECESCLELLSENRDLKEALTKSNVVIRAEEMAQHSLDGKEPIFRFEFHIPFEDVKRYVKTLHTDDCWFNVTIDTKIGKVVAATVGRSVELEAINRIC